MTTIPRPTIELRDIAFRDSEGDIAYVTTENVPQVEGGTDTGRVLVRLNIDGYPTTTVHMDDERSGGLTVVRECIAALQRLEGHLAAVYGEAVPQGRCMASGEYGRCRRERDHDGDHATPTKDQWQAEQIALGNWTREEFDAAEARGWFS